MIEVDEDICIGAGMCALTAPAVFDQREDDGTVVLLNGSPDGADAVAAKEAVELCPSGALRLREG